MPKGVYQRHSFTQPPRTYKDNFWSRERVEKNLKIAEVADMLGYTRSRVSMWFSGQLMPSDATVAEICKLFEVDFNEGQLAFQKAHLEWKAEHGRAVKYSAKKPASSEKKNEVSKVHNVADVIRTLYGKVSCEAFIAIYNTIADGRPGDCDIERLIYALVDFDTYQQIVNTMKS